MSDYTCDICSTVVPRSEIEFHTAATIQRAIRQGLNPWKTPGIDMSSTMSSLTGFAALLGVSATDQYEDWRRRAMADTTDWGLCPACTRAVSRI